MEVSPVVLYVSPSTLNFGSIENSKSFTISNPGFGELNWSLSSNQSWINMTPTSGTNTTNSSNINVTIDRTGLNPNSYNGTISITSNGGNQDIAVSMQVEEDTSIVEHFNNLNNWVNTTYSTSFPELNWSNIISKALELEDIKATKIESIVKEEVRSNKLSTSYQNQISEVIETKKSVIQRDLSIYNKVVKND